MFSTVCLLKQEAIGGNRARATYAVKDSCFRDEVTLECNLPLNEKESLEPAALLLLYTNKKLNVARNLALYYVGMQDAPSYMLADKNFIDREFPSLNYGKSTYRLVDLYHKDIVKAIEDYQRVEEALMESIKAKFNIKT